MDTGEILPMLWHFHEGWIPNILAWAVALTFLVVFFPDVFLSFFFSSVYFDL